MTKVNFNIKFLHRKSYLPFGTKYQTGKTISLKIFMQLKDAFKILVDLAKQTELHNLKSIYTLLKQCKIDTFKSLPYLYL